MLCAGSALAAEWQSGRPNAALLEIDLTEKSGYRVFSANSVLPVDLDTAWTRTRRGLGRL